MARGDVRLTRAERRTRRLRDQRRHRFKRTLAALGLAAVVAGAAVTAGAVLRDDAPPEAQPPPTTAATTTTVVTTTTVPAAVEPVRDPRRGSGEPVVFAFAGDVHFEGGLRGKLETDPGGILAPVAPVFAVADVAMVNLETAITERGAAQDKEYTFRAPATALLALGAAGVDVVSLANNHGIDYGPEGLLDTLAAKAAAPAPAVIGVGADAAEAFTPYRADVRGQRIAVFAATDVLDGNVLDAWSASDTGPGIASAKGAGGDRLATAVQFARLDSDTVVVYLHWGVEDEDCPSTRQQNLARRLVDAGADIVVGSHAHRQQGAGRLGRAFVAYGLGNFAFYNEAGPAGVSGVLLVTATGRDIDTYAWAPAQIRGGVPEPLEPGGGADAAVADWNALRDCADLAP